MKHILKKITLGLAMAGSLLVLQAPMLALAQGNTPAPAANTPAPAANTPAPAANTPAPAANTPAPAANDTKAAVCEGVGLTGTNCDPQGSTSSVTDIVKTVINVLSFIIGVAAVIMIMIGGFKYITSQGDGNSVSSAKNTILYAVIGLVVALLAQVIVRFVIFRVTTAPPALPKCTQPGQQNCTP